MAREKLLILIQNPKQTLTRIGPLEENNSRRNCKQAFPVCKQSSTVLSALVACAFHLIALVVHRPFGTSFPPCYSSRPV